MQSQEYDSEASSQNMSAVSIGSLGAAAIDGKPCGETAERVIFVISRIWWRLNVYTICIMALWPKISNATLWNHTFSRKVCGFTKG
jgi:hypothetical protein